jgi:dTDP-4-amino-4,6-dideoxygalactose transaminase
MSLTASRVPASHASACITSVPLIKADLPSLELIEGALREMLTSGRVTNFGRHVTEFECRAGMYLGSKVVSTSSGTMGLILALQALGLEPGQKVILPSFTFVATAQAVLYAGGIPLFAEIREDLTLDPVDLQQLLDRHRDVRAVIGVHTYGLPCQVEEIQRVIDGASRKKGSRIVLIYDAAHAFGSALHGRRIGTFGDAEVFSLSVTKALVCVEGGIISSRDPELIRRTQKMRNYGIEANYDAHYPGLNGKMSEFHALVGLYNLERLDGYLQIRQAQARYYNDRITSSTSFELLPWPDDVTHTFKDFTVLVPPCLEARRDQVIARLKEMGVETRAYFWPPVHAQNFFARFADRRLPLTESLSRRVITLPFYTSITRDEIDYVVSALADAQARLS